MSLAAVEDGLCAEPSPSWKDSGCSDFMGSAQRASGFRFLVLGLTIGPTPRGSGPQEVEIGIYRHRSETCDCAWKTEPGL